MKRSTREATLAILTIALILSACAGDMTNSETAGGAIVSETAEGAIVPETTGTTTPPAPVETVVPEEEEAPPALILSSIDIILEESSVATAVIGPEGGSIRATDENGIEYLLTVPENALLFEEEITMTAIASAEGDVIGDTFLAGVKLEPEGLHFLELVSIEITGANIEEGSVSFSTETGGQDFHLIPSTSADRSLTITTTHFTEFGVSAKELGELGELASEIGAAWVEHQLARGDASEQLAALERWGVLLLGRGEIGINLNNWTSWTADTLSFILRAGETASKNSWDANTPGFTDLISKMQSLVDLWFQKSDGVVQAVVDKCIQGEIAYLARGEQIVAVGDWLIKNLTLEGREEQTESWHNTLEICFHKTVTWQANVVTTGAEFYSDISIGSEAETDARDRFGSSEALEVEYIEGFWDGKCVPMNGAVDLAFDIKYRPHNLGRDSGRIIDSITVRVNITEPVHIDCSPAGFDIPASAQAPFHGAALDRINGGRVVEGGFYTGWWEFELEYKPGGGVIAQFEEGPETLSWSDGEYELWQLVTIYQSTPAK